MGLKAKRNKTSKLQIELGTWKAKFVMQTEITFHTNTMRKNHF